MTQRTGTANRRSNGKLTRRELLGGLGAFALASTLPTSTARAFTRSGMIDVEGGRLEYSVRGHGPTIYMIPSFGRGCEDFDVLSDTLVHNGYRVVRAQPRGAGSSTSQKQELSLTEMANDAATVLKEVGGTPAVLVGHDFGQRITRTLATQRPATTPLLGRMAGIPKPPDFNAAPYRIRSAGIGPRAAS
ncbi:MAG: alpha/beta hydrolase [Acidobacteriota bacterium]|nr:alpha/beta hydrolase [Acidobacteriota bacterium]